MRKKAHKSLPEAIDAVSKKNLKQGLEDHRKETKKQIALLEKTFESIENRAIWGKFDAIECLIKAYESVIGEASSVIACPDSRAISPIKQTSCKPGVPAGVHALCNATGAPILTPNVGYGDCQ